MTNTKNPTKVSILVIDDCAEGMIGFMDTWGYWANLSFIEWKFATAGDEGLDILVDQKIDLVLMDGHLINEYGHEVVKKIRTKEIAVPVCMFSSDEEQNIKGLSVGAEYAVNKNDFMDGYLDRDNEKIDPKKLKAMDNLAAIILLINLKRSKVLTEYD